MLITQKEWWHLFAHIIPRPRCARCSYYDIFKAFIHVFKRKLQLKEFKFMLLFVLFKSAVFQSVTKECVNVQLTLIKLNFTYIWWCKIKHKLLMWKLKTLYIYTHTVTNTSSCDKYTPFSRQPHVAYKTIKPHPENMSRHCQTQA